MEDTNKFEEELLIEFMKLIQRQFGSVNEILRLTKDLGDAAARDDRVTMQMLLEMRKGEMDVVDGCKKGTELLIENAPVEMQEGLRTLVSGKQSETFEGKIAEQIISLVNSSGRTIEQTVSIDKIISQRMAGGESFYAVE